MNKDKFDKPRHVSLSFGLESHEMVLAEDSVFATFHTNLATNGKCGYLENNGDAGATSHIVYNISCSNHIESSLNRNECRGRVQATELSTRVR